MTQKGLAPILIVLILAFLVGGYLVYQNQAKPTPSPQTISQPSPSPTDETVNWKTYTNTKANYSFKYPDSVKIDVNEKFSVDGVKVPFKDAVVLLSDTLPGLNTNYQMSIRHDLIDNNTSIDKFIVSDQCISTPNTGQRLTLNGKEALLFVDTPCGPYGVTLIYAINNGIGYVFEIETRGSYTAIKKHIDQILSTFKFTN